MSERIEPVTCLGCARALDGRRAVDGVESPDVDGDVSICLYCGNVAIYDPTSALGLRRPTEAERFAIEVDDGIQAALADVRRWQLRQQAAEN